MFSYWWIVQDLGTKSGTSFLENGGKRLGKQLKKLSTFEVTLKFKVSIPKRNSQRDQWKNWGLLNFLFSARRMM